MNSTLAEVCIETHNGIASFLLDPPDSAWQRGFLSALLVVWEDILQQEPTDTTRKANSFLEIYP